MSAEKTEALRMAVLGSFRGGLTLGEVQEAEDELNRLVAQRDALLEACKVALGIVGFGKEHDQIAAAIKAVEGEKE